MLSMPRTSMPKEVHVVVGARPNQMKAAPLLRALRDSEDFKPVLVDTGQHYDHEMAGIFFEQFGMGLPDISLKIGSGSHGKQTGQIMIAYEEILLSRRPDCVIVIGDVNSTVACSLAASKLMIPVVHLEAGLRSHDRTMPEEINRIVTDQLSDLLWTPSIDGDENLLAEGIQKNKIVRVGNMMIDTLLAMENVFRDRQLNVELGIPSPHLVITLHRPSNVDNKETLQTILHQIQLAAENYNIVWPIHPRTNKNIISFGLENYIQHKNIRILKPLGYVEFMSLISSSEGVITDSGGIQEETTYLGIPCLTVRPNTERPITITQGTNELISHNEILKNIKELKQRTPIQQKIEFWDGETAARCLHSLRTLF